MTLSRRHLLQILGASAAVSPVAFAQGVSGRKFIFILLRGGMDGLSALIPDDPEIETLRGDILPAKNNRLNLGNGFRLHPNLDVLHALYRSGEATFIHAASTSFRGRSHFDGQDELERLQGRASGEGWLNRALQSVGKSGLAVGYSIPLALQGEATVTNWAPSVFPGASPELYSRLSRLYAEDPLFSEAMRMAEVTPDLNSMNGSKRKSDFSDLMSAAGKLMAQPTGPNIGMVALDGWDTHVNQGNLLGRRFTALDNAISALKKSLGNEWHNTCVVMCSEFGRTVAANGTRGTDHGTGGLVTLFGGAVKGGTIAGNWPGLNSRALYESRDLAPANDIGAILKGVLRDHLGIDRRALETTVLPGSGRAFDNLII